MLENQENIHNWHAWRHGYDYDEDQPMRVEPVFHKINRVATQDAIFATDVGDTTIYAVRHLDMNGIQQFTTSDGLQLCGMVF